MKLIIAIAFVTLSGLAHAVLSDEQKAKLQAYKKECVEKVPELEVGLIEKAKQGEFSEDGKLAAFLKCFGEKLSFIKEDGSFNVPVIKEKVALKVEGAHVNNVIDQCVGKDEKDATKNAVNLAKCLKTHLPKHEGLF